MTQEYEIYKGRKIWVFTGDQIGKVTSQYEDRPEKDRWTEIEIYRTISDKYILVRYGKSKLPGDKIRINIKECANALCVFKELEFENKDGLMYVTKIAKEVLRQAAELDKGFHDIYYDREDIT